MLFCFYRCLRRVTKDINNVQPNIMQCLPSYIKRNIMKYATGYLFRRLGSGFKDDETVKALLDKDIMHLELTNSLTTDRTLNNISESCPNLQELNLAGSICSFTEIGVIRYSYLKLLI